MLKKIKLLIKKLLVLVVLANSQFIMSVKVCNTCRQLSTECGCGNFGRVNDAQKEWAEGVRINQQLLLKLQLEQDRATKANEDAQVMINSLTSSNPTTKDYIIVRDLQKNAIAFIATYKVMEQKNLATQASLEKALKHYEEKLNSFANQHYVKLLSSEIPEFSKKWPEAKTNAEKIEALEYAIKSVPFKPRKNNLILAVLSDFLKLQSFLEHVKLDLYALIFINLLNQSHDAIILYGTDADKAALRDILAQANPFATAYEKRVDTDPALKKQLRETINKYEKLFATDISIKQG